MKECADRERERERTGKHIHSRWVSMEKFRLRITKSNRSSETLILKLNGHSSPMRLCKI